MAKIPPARPRILATSASAAYYGIYRGFVVNTDDPLQMNRLQAMVPDVPASCGWAMPCTAYTGSTAPPFGAHVWIMFEAGDPHCPVWMGCFPSL